MCAAASVVRKRVFAAYGPTETTVFASLHAVAPDADNERVPSAARWRTRRSGCWGTGSTRCPQARRGSCTSQERGWPTATTGGPA
ncbi:hypothetical protein HFP72_29300 [Nocardiopsis sp. ARC36]